MLLLMINLPSRSNFPSTVAAIDAVSWQRFHLSFPYTHQHSLVGCGGSNIFVWMQKSGDTKAYLMVKFAATSNMAGMSSAFGLSGYGLKFTRTPPTFNSFSVYIYSVYPSHPLGKSAQKCDLVAWAMPI